MSPTKPARNHLHRGIIRGFDGKRPKVDASAFVADNATIIGDVFHIRVGEDTSIQDNAVIHVTHGLYGTRVGSKVTVGHQVTLHGCTVGDLCIVGMGAVILDQGEIGDRCIIGAGALVTPGTKIPAGHLAVGSPARVKRPLTEEELTWLEASALHYVELINKYADDPDWK
jgi:carbonic anhydrase/acetyltransferase-like protein (isoleucine patch superfamily)